MSKNLLALSLLLSMGCMHAMERDSSDSSDTETSSVQSCQEETIEVIKGVPLFTDFLLRVANINVADNYKNGIKSRSRDSRWRRSFKNGGLSDCQKEYENLKLYREFEIVMEEGQKKFEAKESLIAIPSIAAKSTSEEPSGEFIWLTTQPTTEEALWGHYSQSPFVYKLKVGTEAIEQYIKQKRKKREKLVEVRQQRSSGQPDGLGMGAQLALMEFVFRKKLEELKKS